MSSFNKKYQVFISSTFRDLKDERDVVMKYILNQYHIPIGMEMFSADDAEQWEVIRDTIDSSDYYVLIIGHRYGSLDSNGVGWTEREFNYAKSKGIPVLIFIKDRDASTKPDERESEPDAIAKLNAFVTSASTNKLVSFWATKEELALQVMVSFQKAISKNDRIGWVRADRIANPNEVLAEMALLQKENREMRFKLDKIDIQIPRSPAFSLVDGTADQIDIISDSNIWTPFSFVKVNNPNFKVDHFININNYNEEVRKNKGRFIKYNRQKLEFLINNDFKKFNFTILNNGTKKATDVHINIEFPYGLNIFKGKRSDLPGFIFDNLFLPNDTAFKALPGIEKDISKLSTAVQNYSEYENYGILLSGNKIFIRIQSILHTQKFPIFNLFISGSCKSLEDYISVSVACEENPEPTHFEIPVTNKFIINNDLIDIN